MTYHVRRYDTADRDAVLDLQSLHWGPERSLNDQLFAWKYERNPWQRTPRLYLVFHGEELIAMRGFYGSRWEAGSPPETFDIPCAGDLVIRPEHRDRGVFTHLMRFVMDDESTADAPFFFNLSAGAPTRLGGLTLGWRDIGPIPRVRWERPTSVLDRFALKEPADMDSFSGIDARLRANATTIRGSVELSAEVRPVEMATLVRQRSHDGRIRHVRDEAFFAWRFQQPGIRYRFLYHTAGSTINAYLVLLARGRDDNGQVKVVDSEGDRAPLFRLLDTALRDCGFRRVVCWRDSLAGITTSELDRQGFREVPVKSMAESFPTVMLLPNKHRSSAMDWKLGGRDGRDARNWDLRQSYSDGA